MVLVLLHYNYFKNDYTNYKARITRINKSRNSLPFAV